MGSSGGDPGELEGPAGIAISASGLVYVVDANHGVQVFSQQGNYITGWGGFRVPHGVACDASGNVYVADTENSRVRKFTATGVHLTTWGSGGSGPGQFSSPWGIAIDSQGNVYVADNGNARIQKFTADGVYLSEWATACYYLAVDGSDNIYTTLNTQNRVRKFSSSGTLITQWGNSGAGDGEFVYPSGIAIDGEGHVFVADGPAFINYPGRIQKFGKLATAARSTTWGALKSRYR